MKAPTKAETQAMQQADIQGQKHTFVPSLSDRASELAMKLNALICVTYGESGAHFRAMSKESQDAYMWTCADMARELEAVIGSLTAGEVEA